jgi:hypothetical protein
VGFFKSSRNSSVDLLAGKEAFQRAIAKERYRSDRSDHKYSLLILSLAIKSEEDERIGRAISHDPPSASEPSTKSAGTMRTNWALFFLTPPWPGPINWQTKFTLSSPTTWSRPSAWPASFSAMIRKRSLQPVCQYGRKI